MKNKLETLPTCVCYKGVDYTLCVFVNAWDNLVIAYRSIMKINYEFQKILSYCVEEDKEPYIPEIFAATETSGLNEHIGNCKTLDECIDAIKKTIATAVENGELEIGNLA